MTDLLFCSECKAYTLSEVHACGKKTIVPGPAKWSPDDKYGGYRLKARREELEKKGLA
jgi:H/ACA ribonucleoprotein complex subunit 3